MMSNKWPQQTTSRPNSATYKENDNSRGGAFKYIFYVL
jgi:hypothetical protein